MHNRIPALVLAACAAIGFAGTASGEAGYGDSAPFSLVTTARSGTESPGVPLIDRLGPCRPNPFNPSTTISFELAESAEVHLAIYDLRGRLVRTLIAGDRRPAGPHDARWDGRDARGAPAAGGIYLYRIRAGHFVAARSMSLVK